MDQIIDGFKLLVSSWLPVGFDWIFLLPEWVRDTKTIQIVLLIFIVYQLSRQRAALQSTVGVLENRINTLAKLVEAVRDDTETVPDPDPDPAAPSPISPTQGSVEHWESVRKTWASARNKIELAIDERVTDGRKRRRYANMSRYTYRDIIFALRTDGALTTETAAKLIEMNALFLRMRAKPRATTQEQANHFEALYKVASVNLPKEAEPQLPLETPELTAELPSVPWGQQAVGIQS